MFVWAVLPNFLHCIYPSVIFINGCLYLSDIQVTGEEREQTDIRLPPPPPLPQVTGEEREQTDILPPARHTTPPHPSLTKNDNKTVNRQTTIWLKSVSGSSRLLFGLKTYIYVKTLSCVFLSGSETEMESKRDKASESNPDQHKISSNELWDLYLKVKLSSVCSHVCVFTE